jgi:predicted lipoprotein
MLKRSALVLILPLALLGVFPASAAVKASDIIQRAIDGFVRPAYADLDQHAETLTKAMHTLCEAPSRGELDAARAEFSATVYAWSSTEIIGFGPIKENDRLERILYWPDRKSIGLKQVQAALADKDPTATDPAQLAGKSVAMQGLGALEFVLHGAGSEALAAGDPYRCSYGAAISGNLEMIAAELDAAWADPGGFAKKWANPSADNPLYRDGTEAVTELMDAFVTGTELVRDTRLGGFLGTEARDDKPKLALFWRSEKTVDALAGNLAGMKALLEASKLAGALPADQAWMGKEALFEFSNAANAAAGAEGPIAGVLADPDKRSKLAYFGLVTSSLSNIFGTQMSGALGLTAGFSSLDGD